MTRRLKEIMEEEMGVLARIDKIMKEERDVLLSNDAGRLSRLLVQLWELIANLNELEEERIRLVEEMASLLGIPSDQITISRIADEMGDEEMDTIIDKIKDLIEGIRRANEENRFIIEWGMEYAGFVLGILEKIWGPEVEVYGASKGQYSQPLLVDNTA